MVNKKISLIKTKDLAYIEKIYEDKYFFSINNEGNGVMFFYKTNKKEFHLKLHKREKKIN